MVDMVFIALFVILSASLCVTFYRFFIGPHVADRAMCLDLLALISAGLIAVQSVYTNLMALLDIVLLISITGFFGTIIFARFIENNRTKRERS